MKEIIKVNDLNYKIFHNFNISFNKDEFTTISGSNKSGKTLLLKILSRKVLTDDEVLNVIKKQVKVRNASLEEYKTNCERIEKEGLLDKEHGYNANAYERNGTFDAD